VLEFERVVLSEFYGSEDCKLIIFVDWGGSVVLVANCNRYLYFSVQ